MAYILARFIFLNLCLSLQVAALMNKSISTGIYSHLLKHAKVISV